MDIVICFPTIALEVGIELEAQQILQFQLLLGVNHPALQFTALVVCPKTEMDVRRKQTINRQLI